MVIIYKMMKAKQLASKNVSTMVLPNMYRADGYMFPE